MSKLYTNGIFLKPTAYFGLTEFFAEYLDKQALFKDVQTKFGDRTVTIQSKSKMTAGLILSDTSETSAIVKRVDGKGRLLIDVKATTDATGKATTRQAFTFFVVKSNGTGVFTQYKGSGGVGLFTAVFHDRYKQLAAAKHARLTIKERDKFTAKDLRRKTLEISYLIPESNFLEAIDELTKFLSFNVTTVKPENQYDTHFGTNLKAKTESFQFKRGKSVQQDPEEIRRGIREIILGRHPQKGRAKGYGPDNRLVELDITPTRLAIDFAEMSDITVPANFVVDDLFSNPIIKHLEQLMNNPDTQALFYNHV